MSDLIRIGKAMRGDVEFVVAELAGEPFMYRPVEEGVPWGPEEMEAWRAEITNRVVQMLARQMHNEGRPHGWLMALPGYGPAPRLPEEKK